MSSPWEGIWRIGFVLFFTTFLAYLLNMYALKKSPTTIGVLTYVQPIIAILYASFTGNDQMDEVKTLATALVCRGLFGNQRVKV